MAIRVLLLGLVLAFVFVICNAKPAVIDNDPFTEGSDFVDVAGLDNPSENIQNNLEIFNPQPNEESIVEEASVDNYDADDEDGEEETENHTDSLTTIIPSHNSVTKSLTAETVPKNIILTSDSNDVESYGAVVNDDGVNQLVRIVGPGINDEVTLGPNVDTQVMTTRNTMIVGQTIFSDTPGQLIVFEGQNCELRTYPQGTPVRQTLATSQCSQLRALMEQVRRRVAANGSGNLSNQNVAQTTGYAQNYANTQYIPQAVTNAFGQTVANPFGQPATNSYGQFVTQTDPYGLAYSSTNGQSLINPYSQTVAGQTLTDQFGQIVTQTNPFGQTYSNTNGQSLINPYGQTVAGQTLTDQFGQIVTQPNPFAQSYFNPIGQNSYSNGFGLTTQPGTLSESFPFNQATSAFGANWPLAANNVPFNGNSFLNGGNNPPFGPGGEFFGRRPHRHSQGRRRGGSGP